LKYSQDFDTVITSSKATNTQQKNFNLHCRTTHNYYNTTAEEKLLATLLTC